MKVNSFAVFQRMGEENNRAMRLAPLGNILNMKAVKAGTQVTIGVEGNIISGLMNGEYVGGLILCDKAEFERVKQRMEEEMAQVVVDAE